MRQDTKVAVVWGLAAAVLIFSVFIGVVTLVSGPSALIAQLRTFWYYIGALSLGFGVQVGLYALVRTRMHAQKKSAGILATSGAASAGAMVSCCAHYLATALPALGSVGIISAITAYQVQLFWVGILANTVGLGYMLRVYARTKVEPIPSHP